MMRGSLQLQPDGRLLQLCDPGGADGPHRGHRPYLAAAGLAGDTVVATAGGAEITPTACCTG